MPKPALFIRVIILHTQDEFEIEIPVHFTSEHLIQELIRQNFVQTILAENFFFLTRIKSRTILNATESFEDMEVPVESGEIFTLQCNMDLLTFQKQSIESVLLTRFKQDDRDIPYSIVIKLQFLALLDRVGTLELLVPVNTKPRELVSILQASSVIRKEDSYALSWNETPLNDNQSIQEQGIENEEDELVLELFLQDNRDGIYLQVIDINFQGRQEYFWKNDEPCSQFLMKIRGSVHAHQHHALMAKRSGKILSPTDTIRSSGLHRDDVLILGIFYQLEAFLPYQKDISLVPIEILKKGPTHVLFYIQSQKEPEIKLNECKLVFVGSGGTGKTSLIRRLTEDRFDPDEQMTDGIAITHWPVQQTKEQINLRIWDFGGQEIMHATHRFFMTKRSIYVLVLCPRLEDRHGESEAEYWLQLIQSYAENSPIIMIINKCDVHQMDIGRRVLKEKYPQIRGFLETSCKEGKGIDILEKEILETIASMRHLKESLPASFLKIKEALEQENQNHLSYYQYLDICRRIHPDITEPESILFVELLNDLGIMLNISGESQLRDTHVLNPEWITRGVYSIINSPILLEKKGIIDQKELGEILDPVWYPGSKEQGFIMDMMDHFELCYQMPGKRNVYFIPGAFPKDKPQEFDWNSHEALLFRYSYDLLPNKVISRFMVKVHLWIEKELHWRNGVVIRDDNNLALVLADPTERIIRVEILGKRNRRELLAYIRKEFKKIHEPFPNLGIREMIAIDPEGQHWYDYHDILVYEEENVPEIFIPALRKKVSVKSLLEGIQASFDKEYYRRKVSEGKIVYVLDALLDVFQDDNEVYNEVSLLAGRFADLQRRERAGVFAHEEISRQTNNIRFSLLELLVTLG